MVIKEDRKVVEDRNLSSGVERKAELMQINKYGRKENNENNIR